MESQDTYLGHTMEPILTFKLDVFGREVTVKVINSKHADLADCVGSCDMKADEILLSSKYLDNERVFGQILFHELTHALCNYKEEKEIDAEALMVFECLWKNKMFTLPKSYYDAQLGEF